MSGGWGASWGQLPWGGFLLPSSSSPPTPIPCPTEFVIYCYCASGNMGDILTDPRVSLTNSGQFTLSLSNYLCVSSNGVYPYDNDAFMSLSYAVGISWSFQVDAFFTDIPVNFVDIASSHIYFGSVNETGNSAGLFVSAAGLAYAGAVKLVSGVLQLGGSFQVIPGTAGLVVPGQFHRFRIVVDGVTSTTYIFMATPASITDFSAMLTLVAILPGIPSNGFVPDGTSISIVGTQQHPSNVCFTSICLADGLLMQVPPPLANAGKDQALRVCSIGQLDGTASYDPSGGAVSYSWRLIDAPVGSSFEFEGGDGFTHPLPTPTGFTYKFYSAELGDVSATDPVVVGDVLVTHVQISPPGVTPIEYAPAASVSGIGLDGGGFYVEFTAEFFPDNLASIHFKLLRQRFFTGAATAKPTFFPDIPGIYKFDLVVFNGRYLSEPSYVITNVLESQIPKGCTPDLSFVWQYLSDFWKLVEDRERIQVFWEGMAQVVAAEMMTLWQVDYAKSLRDIQRTFQRRWLHHDLKLPEPAPDLTAIRQMYGSVDIYVFDSQFLNVQGTVLEVTSPTHPPVLIEFSLADPYAADALAAMLQRKLQWVDSRYSVIAVFLPMLSGFLVRITAPFLVQVGPNTTMPYYEVGDSNRVESGTGGVRLSSRTYQVDQCLQGLDIKQYDLLVVGGESYRIVRTVSDPSDELPYQRIIVESDLPLLPGSDWALASFITSKFLSFYDGLVVAGDYVTLEVIDTSVNALWLMVVPAMAACAAEVGKIAVDLTSILQYLSLPTVTAWLAFVTRRTRVPVSQLVSDIPCLQEQIQESDDGAVLRRNIDYYLEPFRGQNSIRFETGSSHDIWEGLVPPERMWAETTYLDNRPAIEANFGVPAQFTLDQLAELDSDLDYLSAVQGLWYAYLNGPTMFNMRAGVQILLGLPFAEEEGVIEEIRSDFSTVQGRLLLRDTANPAIVRSYTYPSSLPLETNPATKLPYAVGDTVALLAPMVQGAEIMDYVKNPRWFSGLLSQGNFLEVEKFHKFMVRVDSSAFSLSSLMFVMSFILRVKPTYTRPIFVVRKNMKVAEVNVVDQFLGRGKLILNAGVCLPNFGAAQIYDDYSPAGYGVRNQFDADSDQSSAPPVFPTPDSNITWGFDKGYLCPEDEVVLSWVVSHPGGVVQYDTGFSFDTNAACYAFEGLGITLIPDGPGGYEFPGSYTAQLDGTLGRLKHIVQGTTPTDDFEYVFMLNGVESGTADVLIGAGGAFEFISPSPSVPVTAGDVLTLRLRRTAGGAVSLNWPRIKVIVEQLPLLAFAFDTGLPAGNYYFERTA